MAIGLERNSFIFARVDHILRTTYEPMVSNEPPPRDAFQLPSKSLVYRRLADFKKYKKRNAW